jgi:hypothetical protein
MLMCLSWTANPNQSNPSVFVPMLLSPWGHHLCRGSVTCGRCRASPSSRCHRCLRLPLLQPVALAPPAHLAPPLPTARPTATPMTTFYTRRTHRRSSQPPLRQFGTLTRSLGHLHCLHNRLHRRGGAPAIASCRPPLPALRHPPLHRRPQVALLAACESEGR